MAMSNAPDRQQGIPFGQLLLYSGVLTGDAAYPNPGGYDVTNAPFPKGKTVLVEFFPKGVETNYFRYDRTNHKVYALVNATGVEVANGVDLSALATPYVAIVLP